MTSSKSTIKYSDANLWFACPASVKMSEHFPELRDRKTAIEGVLAHEALIPGASTADKTPEMLEGAEVFDQLLSTWGVPPESIYREHKVEIPRILEGSYGVVDAWAYNKETNTVHIADYKFGHRYVEVFENKQLLSYAAGVLSQLAYQSVLYPKIILYIVQPRGFRDGPVRSWSTSVESIRPYFVELNQKAREATEGPASFNTGAHCRYCRARRGCPTFINAAESSVDEFNDVMPENAGDAGAEEVGDILKKLHTALDRLEAYKSGIEEQALHLLKKGDSIPGYTLEETKGRRQWSVGPQEVITLGELMGVDLCKPREPISPTQAEKLKLDKSIIDSITHRPAGAIKLVQIDTTESRKAFQK